MKERMLAIIDHDGRYAKALSDYLNRQEEFPFLSSAYSSVAEYLEGARQKQDDMILMESAIAEEYCDNSGYDNVVIRLTDTRRDLPELAWIYKFQSAQKIMREVMIYAGEKGTVAAAETPEINRFITGNRIYQRRTVRISMMIKKHLEVNGRESTIYPVFETTDTLAQIVEKTNKLAEEAFAQLDGNSNAFDGFISILYAIPPFLLRGIVGFLMFLDRHGWLPRKLTELQPFHSGFFVTNVGSIGLPVIYHHLYEFGTTSVFVSIGRKEIRSELRPDGTVRTHKILPLRAVVDDRICDGFTYACAFKTIRRCFRNPDILMEAFNPDEK